jgi:hypothetical protein
MSWSMNMGSPSANSASVGVGALRPESFVARANENLGTVRDEELVKHGGKLKLFHLPREWNADSCGPAVA